MTIIKTSAPGSLMLMGEHAILRSKKGLVCAIDKRIYVSLEPRDDDIIQVLTDRLGSYEFSIKNLEVVAPLTFVLASIKSIQDKLPCGFNLRILSDFRENIGFGSSAAVAVTTLAALSRWLGLGYEENKETLFKKVKEIILAVQGNGSGADLAASIWGGTLSLNTDPLKAKKLPDLPGLIVSFCGFKTPTPDVVRKTLKFFEHFPDLLLQIDQTINMCVEKGEEAILHENWEDLGKLFDIHHELLSAYNVSFPIMDDIAWKIREIPGIVGAKISGAGMGDCIIGVGNVNEKGPWSEEFTEIFSEQIMRINIAKEGLTIT